MLPRQRSGASTLLLVAIAVLLAGEYCAAFRSILPINTPSLNLEVAAYS